MADPIPWSFAFGGEASEQLEWLTDVLPALTGPAQTRRLRNAPRIVMTFDGMETGRDRRLLENLVYRNATGRWLVPLPLDDMALTADAPAGAIALAGAADGRRFGALALIQGVDASAYEVVSIDAATSSGLALSAPTTRAWKAGTRVLPLVLARFSEVPTIGRFTGDAVSYQASWRLEEPLDWNVGAWPATYRGYPVLEWGPDWSTDPTWLPARNLLSVDAATGPISVVDAVGDALVEVGVQITAVGQAERAALRTLLYTLAGRWRPIWVSSFAQDLALRTAAGAGASSIDVEACGLYGSALRPNRRDLRIELITGQVLYRRVTAVTLPAVGTERLQLDAALGVDVAPLAVGALSWLALCRQTADVNKLRYWSAEVTQTQLTFKGEPNGI